MEEHVVPSASAEMSLREAMQTQRAIRRLKPDPVPDDVIDRCVELALKAPTGSNAQNWEWIVVRDPEVKRKLARLNRIPWSVYGRLGKLLKRNDPKMLKVIRAVQWQADHYEEIPALVVPCLRGPRFTLLHGAATAYYGSAYPAVQNFPSWPPGPRGSERPSPPFRCGRPRWPGVRSGCRSACSRSR